ncbi:MAG: PD-(D/E)XK nuclease family protein [Candidatus Cybelea sp.]
MSAFVANDLLRIHIAPSDLAFLFKECPRCFYDKYRANIRRPSIFLSFFNVVDRAMKARYGDGSWHEIANAARLTYTGLEQMQHRIRFRVIAQDGWVTSESLPVAGVALSVRGVFDTVIEIDGGPLAICDFKTTFPKLEHLWFYRRPLHAYAYACEHPAPRSRHRYVVPRLGLLVFCGNEFASNAEFAAVCGSLTWIELERTDDLFLRFMSRAARLLALPTTPAAATECSFCTYRSAGPQPNARIASRAAL